MKGSGQLNSWAADEVLVIMIETGKDPEDIAKSKKLLQVSDESEIEKIVDKVISSNQSAVGDYQKGNENSLQFLVGQVMKLSSGQANPQLARDMLKKKIGS